MFKRKKILSLRELEDQLTIASKEKSNILHMLQKAEDEYQKAGKVVDKLKVEYVDSLFDLNFNGGAERFHVESMARKAYALAVASYKMKISEYSTLTVRYRKSQKVYNKLKKQISKLEKE